MQSPRVQVGLITYGATRKLVRMRKSNLSYTSKACIAAVNGLGALYVWPAYVIRDLQDWECAYRRRGPDNDKDILESLVKI